MKLYSQLCDTDRWFIVPGYIGSFIEQEEKFRNNFMEIEYFFPYKMLDRKKKKNS